MGDDPMFAKPVTLESIFAHFVSCLTICLPTHYANCGITCQANKVEYPKGRNNSQAQVGIKIKAHLF